VSLCLCVFVSVCMYVCLVCTFENICCKFAHDGLLDIHCLKVVRIPPDKRSQ